VLRTDNDSGDVESLECKLTDDSPVVYDSRHGLVFWPTIANHCQRLSLTAIADNCSKPSAAQTWVKPGPGAGH
jgi:hypothetical protein